MMSGQRCACRTAGVTSAAVHSSNAQAATDRADRSTVIVLPVQAHPQGAMAASTINRTVKSLALGKVAAEYVLRWVPAGTHDWRKFVKPSELARHVRAGGLTLTALSGMAYDPIKGDWKLGDDLAVNYLAFAVRT